MYTETAACLFLQDLVRITLSHFKMKILTHTGSKVHWLLCIKMSQSWSNPHSFLCTFQSTNYGCIHPSETSRTPLDVRSPRTPFDMQGCRNVHVCNLCTAAWVELPHSIPPG